ncbi:MAG: type IX secretion system membrane protein PorP/SprF [Treponema sp.]|nr:type IX secretion system membrane protein PorP/SprF [Candidatus Treponema equifaecale]
MKKIAMAVLAAAVFGASLFAEAKVTFENKVFEDDVISFDDGNESTTDFPALKERMAVQLDSDKVDAYVKATLALDDYDGKHFGVQGEVNDWWVEFRPVDPITLCLHDNIYSDGSYLPIYDDNMAGGNIGSDGFTTVIRPPVFNKAFRLGLTVPFSFDGSEDEKDRNYFNGNKDDGEDENFHFGVGVIYSLPKFQLGFTAQNLTCSDDRVIGVSVNFPGTFVEGLTVGAGFTNAAAKDAGFGDILSFSDDYAVGVTGENVINAAVSYEKDAFSCAVETLISTEDKVDGEKFLFNKYVGVSVGYAATDALSFGAFGKFLLVTDSDVFEDNAMGFGFTADYAINDNNTVGVEFDYNMCGDASAIAVPVYWKYSF